MHTTCPAISSSLTIPFPSHLTKCISYELLIKQISITFLLFHPSCPNIFLSTLFPKPYLKEKKEPQGDHIWWEENVSYTYLWNIAHRYKLLSKLPKQACAIMVNLILAGSLLLQLFMIHCIRRCSNLNIEILVNSMTLWCIMHNSLVIENNEHHFDFPMHVECFLLHKFVTRKISTEMEVLKFWIIL